jgi:hypothetical protein
MAWEKPAEERPVWCAVGGEKAGMPTAESVSCTTDNPEGATPQVASLQLPLGNAHGLAGDVAAAVMPVAPVSYKKFTNQDDLGHFLVEHYKIRTPRDLTSCEVCHR